LPVDVVDESLQLPNTRLEHTFALFDLI